MSHVFVSYVRENMDQVTRLQQDLAKWGINVWLDRNEIQPGVFWKDAIRNAIREGTFFIACFSAEYQARPRTFMNEELTLALELLRQQSTDHVFFIPVLLSDCKIANLPFSQGVNLHDIQWVKLYDGWADGIRRIVRAIQPTPNNLGSLPIYLKSSLVGREREVTNIALKFGQELRLLIVTGPPGVGKTRFAVEVGKAMLEHSSDYPDGIWFLELAPIRDEQEFLYTIADVLDITRECGRKRELEEQIVNFLRFKRMLLIFDNFEQLLVGDPSPLGVVEAIINRASSVRCIVTSRESPFPQLPRPIQEFYKVEPLSYPLEGRHDIADIESHESVKLFKERTGCELTRENSCAIAKICRQLSGIPLAIELVASWRKTPHEISKNLHRYVEARRRGPFIPERHGSLAAALDWSYDLLSKNEQEFFAQLSVFVGEFTENAVEAISGATDRKVQKTIGNLHDKSLLSTKVKLDRTYYYMLEFVRQYASQKFDVTDKARIQRAHAEYYLRYCQHKQHDFALLAQERSNIRAAMEWYHENGKSQMVLDFFGALRNFLDLRGYWDERLRWAGRAIEAAKMLGDEDSTRASAWCHIYDIGWIRAYRGQYEEAEEAIRKGIEIAQGIKCQFLVAFGIRNLGYIERARDALEEAEKLYKESLRILEELRCTNSAMKDKVELCKVQTSGHLSKLRLRKGQVLREQGDEDGAKMYFKTARQNIKTARDIKRRRKDKTGEAFTLAHLGWAEWKLGNEERAERCFKESEDLCSDTSQEPQPLTYALLCVLRSLMHEEQARSFARRAEQICEQLGLKPGDLLK